MATVTVETYEDGVLIDTREVEVPDPDPAALAAIAHARSLGFTDDMIRAMYPALADAL
jgi:hypothetical protein